MAVGIVKQQPSLVSVCIPTYNRCESLKKAISCVLQQTHTNIELIIVDNASTDRTEFLVDDINKKGALISYYKNDKNIGAVKNFVKAMSLATGEYCMWLADDDWQDRDYIEKCLFELESNEALALVAGRCRYFVKDTPTRLAININLQSKSKTLRLLKHYFTVGDSSIFYGLYRKSILDGVIFKEILGADWLFVAAIAFRGEIKTLQSTHLNRDEFGASTDLTSLAVRLGYSTFLSRAPYFIVCIEAYRDLMNEDAIYGHLRAPTRRLLATSVFLIVFIKKIVLQKIYRALRYVKNYVFTHGKLRQ